MHRLATRGFGNGTATADKPATRGFTVGDAIVVPPAHGGVGCFGPGIRVGLFEPGQRIGFWSDARHDCGN